MIDPPTESTETHPGEIGLVRWKDYVHTGAFTFESGEKIPGFTLRYETYGKLNPQKDNAILICHALSGDHHCAGIHNLNDKKQGWWNNMIGPGKPIDTNKYFIICSNCLGGCQGSTGPKSINPETGNPYNMDFPLVSIRDMVRSQYLLLREGLGVESIYAVIGGSMGGMQVLQWGIDYPDFVRKLIPMATTARQNAQAIAFNEVGRLAVMQDPEWQNGAYGDGKGPNVGLAVARMMAHITYLSDAGLEEKFGRDKVKPNEARSQFDAEFQVESYLRYQGQSFISRFDANSYLYLTKALDRFDLFGESGQLEDRVKAIRARTLVVAFKSDWLFPPAQNRAIVHALLRCGCEASYAELDLTLGHDSFLVNAPDLYQLVHNFLNA
ncbi:homoserine O-acetyltransferase [Puniceicoccales bacterium CK1056]|uniref:Homoserine O-acetyltransferase n=1 Tax=Oceanipulchritudo coccoides TaxID=2706888 RepID=A0A6B2M145_9BACT|nr:homoserine O-acetyltransferase [Oceanipulchritudo coccoides]NDV62086.1 homoserine O-acetyltransferase [Oceanipulchritudo coccoides]